MGFKLIEGIFYKKDIKCCRGKRKHHNITFRCSKKDYNKFIGACNILIIKL